MITKADIEKVLKNQHDGHIRCPRCGKKTMKIRLHTNALSRRADVYICDKCGTKEAIEDMLGKPKPFEQWAISKVALL